MFTTAGYPAHPPYFDYRTPPRTPHTTGGAHYYSPRQYAYAATPPKPQHTRRATHDFAYTTTYATPRRPSAYHDPPPPDYVSPVNAGYTSAQPSTSQRKYEYVSRSDRERRRGAADGQQSSPAWWHTASARQSHKQQSRSRGKDAYRESSPTPPHPRSSRRQQRTFVGAYYGDDGVEYYSRHEYDRGGGYDGEVPHDDYLPRYEMHETRPPPYQRHPSFHRSPPATQQHETQTDHASAPHQVPIYTSASAEQSKPRPRRASHTAPKASTRPSNEYREPPSTRRPATATKAKETSTPAPPPETPVATAADARRAGIPAGYSYKNWDPSEEPILLLGSVFDANSLGKWIYDWTVFYHGPGKPITDVAGELWLLLIQLAGKIKRAEDILPRVRRESSRDLVEDFLESGERLWQRFSKLLKICEGFMWRVARKEGAKAGAAAEKAEEKVRMGRSSGCEFVDAIFGRDRELNRTEKLMTGMRLWSMRFDANCEEILREPSR